MADGEAGSTTERDHWGSDEKYPREDWQYLVSNNETSLGYWDWVDNQYDMAQFDTETEDAKT